MRTDGNDSNNGLANTAGGAFLTIQKAINALVYLDLGLYNCKIKIGAGTYAGGINLKKYLSSGGKAILEGDIATPSNVIIEGGSGTCFNAIGTKGSSWEIRGLKNQSSNNTSNTRSGLFLSNADIDIKSIDFGLMPGGAYSSRHIHSTNKSLLRVLGSYDISGGANMHLLCDGSATVDFRDAEAFAPVVVTLSNSPTFNNGAFWWCASMGLINCFAGGAGLSFFGSATGTRYAAYYNSLILTNGGGATFLPGNVNGSPDATSIYA